MKDTIQKLIDLQAGKTIEQFCFSEDGGLTLTRFQTELERGGLRASRRNFFIGEILDVVNASVLKDVPVTEELIKKYNDSNSCLSVLYAKDANHISELSDDVEAIVSQAKKLMAKADSANIDYEIKEKLKDFADKKIFGKNVLKSTDKLVDSKKIKEYEGSYKALVNGTKIKKKDKDCWQYGWNEAQFLIKEMVQDLSGELSACRTKLEHHQKRAESIQASAKKLKPYEKQALDNDKRQTESLYISYDAISTAVEKWKRLYKATENFRNNDKAFPEDLWQDFNEAFKVKSVGGKTLNATPPVQIMLCSPVINLANDLAKPYGVKFYSAGIKTEDSTRRKANNPKFEGKPDKIFDAVRYTISVPSNRGVKFLLENLKDVSKEGDMPIAISKELYESYLFNYKINRAVGLNLGTAENPRWEYRVGEEKVVPEKLLEAKKELSDEIYHIRREMKPEQEDGSRKFLDVRNRLNDVKVEFLHEDIVNFLKDERVVALISEHNIKLGFNIQKIDEFKVQKNFEHIYNKFTDIERAILIDAISKSDYSIKKDVFITAVEKLIKPERGSNFSEADLKNISLGIFKDDFERLNSDKDVLKLKSIAGRINLGHIFEKDNNWKFAQISSSREKK